MEAAISDVRMEKILAEVSTAELVREKAALKLLRTEGTGQIAAIE